MSALFAGNPVRDTEDFDAGVARFSDKFGPIFAIKAVDDALLKDVHARATAMVAAAGRGHTAAWQYKWKSAWRRMQNAARGALTLVEARAAQQGVALPPPAAPAAPTAAAAASSPPTCKCGMPARRRVSGTQKNARRPFFGCAKYPRGHCNFFSWAE